MPKHTLFEPRTISNVHHTHMMNGQPFCAYSDFQVTLLLLLLIRMKYRMIQVHADKVDKKSKQNRIHNLFAASVRDLNFTLSQYS